jgi:hypothetical protein
MSADRETLMGLAERCEQAPAEEQREWLEQAFYAINEAPDYGTDERAEWVEKSRRFHRLINADAFLDAAMTLVPEGCLWRLEQRSGVERRDGIEHRSFNALAGLFDFDGYSQLFAIAATPALALTAASLRAIASKGTDHEG